LIKLGARQGISQSEKEADISQRFYLFAKIVKLPPEWWIVINEVIECVLKTMSNPSTLPSALPRCLACTE
jgi:hypothetical protein